MGYNVIFYPLNAMKVLFLPAIALLFAIFCSRQSVAQLPYNQSFKGNTAPGLVLSGSARLTALSGIDPSGAGYLRLTDNIANQVGYAYAKDAFPSSYGLTITFEFFTYKADASGFNQADGISFFLFDASVNSFRPGGVGGSLGYSQYWNTPGMSKGYLGIGIDEYGNFSNPTEKRNGGPGRRAGSIVVRGPGDGNKTTDYVYVAGVQTDQAPYNIPFTRFTQRFPDFTSANYRRIKIILTPGSSLGTNKGYTISVTLFKGGTPTGTEVTLINNFDYPYLAPSTLQYGFAASTGSNTDFHEIRNLNIVPTNTAALVNPTAQNDSVAICQGPKALLDVTANDMSNNTGGLLLKSLIDLDPSTAGIQNAFADGSKGSYSVDQNGIVTFTPGSGFSGVSQIPYVVTDNYGYTSPPATIKVNVTPLLGPGLTVTNPAGVCAPQVADITSPSLRTNTTAGATYSYFTTLANANNNTNNIDASAASISNSGLYFIRAMWGGCYHVQPVTVQVSQMPTAANAGSTQFLCSPGSTGLSANDPLVGVGNWMQVSGPATASFVSPAFSNSTVSNLQKGSYLFRWTVSNGACPASVSNVAINVTNPSAAGSNQVLANTATTTTLQANDPAPGTGLWVQENTGAPAATIVAPNNPQTAVNGLLAGNNYRFRWTITNNCTSTSTVDVTIPAVLPVRFLSFTGEKVNRTVVLKWKTAAEKNNSHFVLLRSENGQRYSAVGTVAAGSGEGVQAYAFTDDIGGVSEPIAYYKLQQVDRDNQSSYSAVVRVDLEAAASAPVRIWPNPFHHTIWIEARFSTAGTAIVRLSDVTGRLVRQQAVAVRKGANSLQLTTAGEAPGFYMLEVVKDGEQYQQKLVRQ